MKEIPKTPGDQIDLPENTENATEVRFHLYSLQFTPNKDSRNKLSNDILFDIVTFISQEKVKGNGYLIDRHQERPKDGKRELFMTRAVIHMKEKRVRCCMALLRGGRVPKLKPVDRFELVPLDQTMGSIAEETHFFIDYSKGYAVLCIEYNYHGPRLSDIEYYFRHIARDKLKLARATEVSLFMETSLDDAYDNLRSVLNLDIKVQPKKLAQLDTALVGQYLTGITTLGQKINPKFIKIEAMFQTPGRSVKSAVINKGANDMISTFLKKFKATPDYINCFDSFVVRYEDKEGNEKVLDLLKGKREIIKNVDINGMKPRDVYQLIESDLDNFVASL